MVRPSVGALSPVLSHSWDVWPPPRFVASLSYKYFIFSVATASNIFLKRHFLFLFFSLLGSCILKHTRHVCSTQTCSRLSPKCNCFQTADSWRKQFSLHNRRLQLLSSPCKPFSHSPAVSVLLCYARHLGLWYLHFPG